MVKFVNKRVGELFDVVMPTAVPPKSELTNTLSYKYSTPLINAQTENNGIAGYSNSKTSIITNIPAISVGSRGSINFYVQSKPFIIGNSVIALIPKIKLSELTLLYICTLIKKQNYNMASGYTDYPTKIRLSTKDTISVPVTPSGELDTEYMASYVQKIEASYVQKIEASYVQKIEAYLAVLGYKSLADCQLNQHDLDVLHDKPKMKNFKVENLLYKVELKWHGDHKFDKLADTSESKTKEFNLPLLNAKHGNNGIMFYGRKDEWDQAKNIIDVVSNGAVATGDVYFQTNNIGVMWDAYALNTKQTVSAKAKEYIATSLKKAIKLIFGWENKAVWSKVRNIKITLPVTSSGTPDWQFMEDYITAIEKLKVLKIKQFLDTKINAYQNKLK